MGKKRLTYIDSAKGILILLMIWFHVTYVVDKTIDGCNLVIMEAIREYTNSWFTVFFMPAFFIITGYCSKFTENRIDFYTKMLKTIVIPVAIISYIRSCVFDFSFTPLHLLGPYKPNGSWFIISLLISRSIYYESSNIIRNKIWLFVFLFTITIVALICRDNAVVPNPFYWKQGLCASLFIGIGRFMRNYEIKDRWLYVVSILYVLAIIIINIFGIHRTVMVVILHPEWYEIFQFVFLAVTGTAFVIFVSKKIDCGILNYIGRFSLVIFLMQYAVMRTLAIVFSNYIDVSQIGGCIVMCVVIYPITVIACLLFVKCFDTKYGNYILGKY